MINLQGSADYDGPQPGAGPYQTAQAEAGAAVDGLLRDLESLVRRAEPYLRPEPMQDHSPGDAGNKLAGVERPRSPAVTALIELKARINTAGDVVGQLLDRLEV